MSTDQIAAEAADRLRDEEGAHFHRDAGIAIIESAIKKALKAATAEAYGELIDEGIREGIEKATEALAQTKEKE